MLWEIAGKSSSESDFGGTFFIGFIGTFPEGVFDLGM